MPTAQERQEARLERLIAHEKTQINHLSLAALDEDAAWRATREAAIARCRVRLAGYISELEREGRGKTSAISAARSDAAAAIGGTTSHGAFRATDALRARLLPCRPLQAFQLTGRPGARTTGPESVGPEPGSTQAGLV
jgi:hypothetical protein